LIAGGDPRSEVAPSVDRMKPTFWAALTMFEVVPPVAKETSIVSVTWGAPPVEALTRMLELVMVKLAGKATFEKDTCVPLTTPKYVTAGNPVGVTTRTASLFPLVAKAAGYVTALLVTGKESVRITVPVVAAPVNVHVEVTSATSSVVDSARSVGFPVGTMPPAGQATVCPYDTPAKAVATAASPKSLLLKSAIYFLLLVKFLLESVEVLCNLSLNYNESLCTALGNFSVSGGGKTGLLSSSGQRRRYILKGVGLY
jgi:hypothetical protein